MKREEELYLESYVERLISLTVESGYKLDKLGNIVYKDKSKTVKQLSNTIKRVAKQTNLKEDEINDYLIKIYKEKCAEDAQEGKEIVRLLSTLNKKDNNENKVHKPKEKTH